MFLCFSTSSTYNNFTFTESDEPITESGELQALSFGDLDVRVGRIYWVDVHINDLGHFHMKVNFNGSLLLTCVSLFSFLCYMCFILILTFGKFCILLLGDSNSNLFETERL